MTSALLMCPDELMSHDSERQYVVCIYREWVNHVLSFQIHDASLDDGAFIEAQTGWNHGRHTAYNLGHMLAACCLGDDLDVDRHALHQSIRDAVAFILRRQAPDGRMDLGGMYSPNEVGFTLPGLAAGYRHLPNYAPELFEQIKDDLKTYMIKGAQAVLEGVAYTANHRWAAASGPLAAVHRIFPDQRYLDAINNYLADGIDCNEDGFWHIERSPNYNDVANNGMIVLADNLNRPQLLDHVRRNLELMMSQVQPNGECDSSYSHRQDRHQPTRPVTGYLAPRRIAMLTGDGRYTTQAIIASPRLRSNLFPVPYELIENPGTLPAPIALAETYHKDWPSMQMARKRSNRDAVTLHADSGGHFFDTVRDTWGGVKRSEDWIHLHHGNIVIQTIRLQLANGLAIMPQSMEKCDVQHYRLSGREQAWPHTLHFRPGSPVHQTIHKQEHQIDVQLLEHGMTIHLQCQSPDYLFANLNLYVRQGATLNERVIKAGEVISLEGEKDLVLSKDEDILQISGLPKANHIPGGSFNSALPDNIKDTCACLCLGLRFPVDLILHLKW